MVLVVPLLLQLGTPLRLPGRLRLLLTRALGLNLAALLMRRLPTLRPVRLAYGRQDLTHRHGLEPVVLVSIPLESGREARTPSCVGRRRRRTRRAALW